MAGDHLLGRALAGYRTVVAPGQLRQARFQLVAEDGTAWLAVVQDGQWLIEASYD